MTFLPLIELPVLKTLNYEHPEIKQRKSSVARGSDAQSGAVCIALSHKLAEEVPQRPRVWLSLTFLLVFRDLLFILRATFSEEISLASVGNSTPTFSFCNSWLRSANVVLKPYIRAVLAVFSSPTPGFKYVTSILCGLPKCLI